MCIFERIATTTTQNMFRMNSKPVFCLFLNFSRFGRSSVLNINAPIHFTNSPITGSVHFSSICAENEGNYCYHQRKPTLTVNCRQFRSGKVHHESHDQPKSDVTKHQPRFNLTLKYSFQFVYAYMRDQSIVYHLNRSFLNGIVNMFFMVSDSLHHKNYYKLTEFVTPELLEKINYHRGICTGQNERSENVFLAKQMALVSLRDLKLNFDKDTKIKTLQIQAFFAFYEEYKDLPKTFKEFKELTKNKSNPMKFAKYTFERTYGDEVKDSPWIIRNLERTRPDSMDLAFGYTTEPLFKKWKKSWMVVSLGGNLKYFSSKRSSSPQKTWNLRQDLIVIKSGKQCRTLLPPPDVDTNCLFELHFTGGKKLSCCAKDLDSVSLWMQALTRAQSDRELPTPKYSRKNRTREDELKEESLKQNERQEKLWYRFLCCGGSNQVKNFTTPRPPVTKGSWT